jgi:hypothetical protein
MTVKIMTMTQRKMTMTHEILTMTVKIMTMTQRKMTMTHEILTMTHFVENSQLPGW